MAPIAGTPALVSDRCNEYMVVSHAIKDGVRESIEHETVLAAHPLWPLQRCLGDTSDGVIELESERVRGDRASLVVPDLRLRQLLLRFAMKPDARHRR